MSELHGLIFDVDGVIADTEAVNAEVSIRVFEELFNVSGVQRGDFEAGLGRGAHEYLLAAARIHNLELSEQQLETATQARQDKFLQYLEQKPLPAFPGVRKLISAALASTQFQPAIATSSTREKSEAVLRSAGIPYDKMAYITGSEVKNKKPHPELFQKAAAALKIPPAQCVVIEDAPNGVKAAQAAGCKCIAVTNSTTAEKLAAADLIVNSLAEVDLTILQKLLQNRTNF